MGKATFGSFVMDVLVAINEANETARNAKSVYKLENSEGAIRLNDYYTAGDIVTFKAGGMPKMVCIETKYNRNYDRIAVVQYTDMFGDLVTKEFSYKALGKVVTA